jgi:hypothetical protein
VIHVPDRPDVQMRLRSLKLLLGHDSDLLFFGERKIFFSPGPGSNW